MSSVLKKYEKPIDIYGAFRDKDDVSRFLYFLFSHTDLICDMMDLRDKSDVIYPIIYDKNVDALQIDYVYFVYVLGKYYAKLSEDDSAIAKVIDDFGLISEQHDEGSYRRDMKMLVFFFEEYYAVFSNGNYRNQCQYFSSFKQKILTNGVVDIEYKALTFNKKYLEEYIDIDKIMEDSVENIYQENVKQVAFGNKFVKDFWSKNGNRKSVYLFLNQSDFTEMISEDFIVSSILNNY